MGSEAKLTEHWYCEKCNESGAVETERHEDVYSVRNRIEADHARLSPQCAAEWGLSHVRSGVRPADMQHELQEMISRAFDIADTEYPDKGNSERNEWEDARWYSMLRALIIDAFNPPDEDVAECSLLADSVAAAFAFIVAQPCSCTSVPIQMPYGPDLDWTACERCSVLGRVNDERLER